MTSVCDGHGAGPGFAVDGHESQSSPLPSPSVSCCDGFATDGQLSRLSGTPSESASGSVVVVVVVGHGVAPGFGKDGQASPWPSASVSCCVGFTIAGQLSRASGTPSPSESGTVVVVVVVTHVPSAVGFFTWKSLVVLSTTVPVLNATLYVSPPPSASTAQPSVPVFGGTTVTGASLPSMPIFRVKTPRVERLICAVFTAPFSDSLSLYL